MTFSRRILLPGALIALPVIFAVGTVAFAQSPGTPQLPQGHVVVEMGTPSPTPAPVQTADPVIPPAPAPPAPAPPAPAPPAPAPAPPADDDHDDDDGDDDGDDDD